MEHLFWNVVKYSYASNSQDISTQGVHERGGIWLPRRCATQLAPVCTTRRSKRWKVAYRHKGHSLSASLTKFDQMKELTGVRKDDPEFWGALSLQIPRGVIVRLERARQSFFRACSYRRDARLPPVSRQAGDGGR